MGRRTVCAKAESQLQHILVRKRQVLAEERTIDQIKYEMTRDSAPRQQVAKAGLLRLSVLLVSMTPSVRARLAVQLGLSPLNQPYFGEPPRGSLADSESRGTWAASVWRSRPEQTEPIHLDPRLC